MFLARKVFLIFSKLSFILNLTDFLFVIVQAFFLLISVFLITSFLISPSVIVPRNFYFYLLQLHPDSDLLILTKADFIVSVLSTSVNFNIFHAINFSQNLKSKISFISNEFDLSISTNFVCLVKSNIFSFSLNILF